MKSFLLFIKPFEFSILVLYGADFGRDRERQSAYIPTMNDDYDDDNDDDRNELQVEKKFILISKVKERKKDRKKSTGYAWMKRWNLICMKSRAYTLLIVNRNRNSRWWTLFMLWTYWNMRRQRVRLASSVNLSFIKSLISSLGANKGNFMPKYSNRAQHTPTQQW